MGPLTLAGWIHILFFGVAVPVLVLRTKRRIDTGFELPPFHRHIVLAVLQLVVLGGLSIGVALAEGIELFPARLPSLRAWLAGALLYAIAIATMASQWRRAVARRGRVLRLFMPRSRRDRLLWVGASAVAGVSEEITWRGVQFVLLWILTGDPFVAACACAVMFGAAHMVQGWSASAVVIMFALAFQLLVYYSGTLYVAMAVHFAYDLTAGWRYGRLADELGYFAEQMRQPGAGPLRAAEARATVEDSPATTDGNPCSAGEPGAAADPENRS